MRNKYVAPGAVEFESLEDLDDSKRCIVKILCADCHEVINESKKALSKAELDEHWTMLVMSAPLNTGPCPKCGQSTYSDCNMHTDLCLFEAERGSVDDE